MKVLMLGRYPTGKISGGVAVHNVNLIHNLGLAGGKKIDIRMVSFGDESRTFYDGAAQIKTIKIHKLYYLLPVLPLMKLLSEIRKAKPDIIHVQGIGLSPYLISALFSGKKYKKAITIHGHYTRELIAHQELKYRTPKYYFLSWLEKRGLNDADLLLCVTNILKDWALAEQKGGRPKRVVVMPNGVDLQLFRPGKKSEIRQGSGIPEKDFIIFLAKGFVARNGHEYLIRAMPEILKHVPEAKLYLAGEGPLKPEMEKLTEDLGVKNNVIFLGDLPNEKISGYLAASDVVCLPSIRTEGLEEGSSIFLVEAMAMEKPCIASDMGGLTESISNGVNGLLIPDKDETAIASAVIRLYDDPALADTIAKNARLYVERKRNWGVITDELLRLYQSIIS
jgi:glycosyltransferase involved in cell wall biosynthesis